MANVPELVTQLVERSDLSAQAGHARAGRNRDAHLAVATMNEERILRPNEFLVYELYGLTEEEIKIVEGET